MGKRMYGLKAMDIGCVIPTLERAESKMIVLSNWRRGCEHLGSGDWDFTAMQIRHCCFPGSSPGNVMSVIVH